MATSTTTPRTITTSAATPKPKDVVSQGKYSLHIDIGWTFSKGKPDGQYTLRLNGTTINDGKNNQFSNGQIYLDRKLDSLTGTGELLITVKNGPTYKAKVKLGGLPHVATPDGLARRLTNLGFYAGPETGGKCNARMAWAIRAFKRVKMNNYTRNSKVYENNEATAEFLKAVRDAYGKQPDDAENFKQGLKLTASEGLVDYCRMFGDHTYCRGSFETKGQADDIDQGPGQNGVWGGKSAADPKNDVEVIGGEYMLYLRAFDPNEQKVDLETKRKLPMKIEPFTNRVNLPQPIHMAQFVLFELGYWLVAGEKDDFVKEDSTLMRQKFIPDGWFGRYSQWAAREFQCYAKFDYAAKEDVTHTEPQFLPRVYRATGDTPARLTGNARYPNAGKVNGELNEETRKALQAWADGVLRSPMSVCASKIYNSKG